MIKIDETCADAELFNYLQILVDNQTTEERECRKTIENNGIGFNQAHASKGISLYNHYIRGDLVNGKIVKNFFYPKQREYLIKMLPKYKNQY